MMINKSIADDVKKIKHLPDGSIFEGELTEEGVMHGKGKLITFDGDVYNGQWKNGVKHGNFKVAYNSGNKFEGEFKQGY